MLLGPFPGSERERAALLEAVRRGCRCAPQAPGKPVPLCGVHTLLMDESALKRLIFYRRWQHALRRGEWLGQPEWSGPADIAD
jgi:hypothetical protein